MRPWLPVSRGSPFSLANIPFGIISTAASPTPRPATILGDNVLDLRKFAEGNGFANLGLIQPHLAVFSSQSLNGFAALGRPVHSSVRKYLQDVLSESTSHPQLLKDNEALRREALLPVRDVVNHVPMEIGDYTDFFAGINHAFTVGSLFRGPQNALQPNYKHLPVAYHGRASSVVVSGTPVRRPWGQILENPAAKEKIPVFAPCRRLDIELELGAFVCKANPLGQPIPVTEAAESIFGYVLMNDWSARDLQTWEYVPLGPFNAKNFATTISPWVVLPDALEPFATAGIENDTKLLPYLQESDPKSQYDIRLRVVLTTRNGIATTITETNSRNLLWSFPQMLAHHTITGCPMRPGDLLGSGTISGEEDTARGSLLEQNKGGKQTIRLNGGEERKFLQDGDTITIVGICGLNDDSLVGFGECSGQITEALKLG
ncbi:Fumarylacetoacetase [Penicillium mononematosum]|uniref:Fumarylacetoacetase n=1 Tax=Penicillium mononematosum TaxID=268346 RepID=UPI002546768A|nr:Fumarylacetoacetase [Penicillium mononematosum]KAJ6186514.1 Fumarylacetoacetase [Penicillium mononematosum]